MHDRFFAPDAAAPGDVVALPPDEAQHLSRVLRLKAGDRIRVFNGRGGEFRARLETVGRDAAGVLVGEPVTPAREAAVAVTLVQAVLKGDKMDDVVRDAVMVGVAAIQPLLTARTEVAPAALQRGHRRERWQRIAIASAKQCGRAVVPAIGDPLQFMAAIAAVTAGSLPAPALMLVEPGAADASALSDVPADAPRQATLMVGPEGGWTGEETAAGVAACRLLTLGARTLRADAMASIAVAALFARWGEL